MGFSIRQSEEPDVLAVSGTPPSSAFSFDTERHKRQDYLEKPAPLQRTHFPRPLEKGGHAERGDVISHMLQHV